MLDLIIRSGRVVDGTGAPAVTADVAIQGDRIVEVGRVTGSARREIDADGLLVTPGWIDVHTHYDGQVTWDPMLEQSACSGVTTAIIGNCGVGFAPVLLRDRERLIDFMEGVEEIPASVLRSGMTWNWESFPDYLGVLDAMPRSFDIGALLPHGPLRLWAMGNRVDADKCAGGDDLAAMVAATEAAMKAGAFGLSTSRTPVHRSLSGAMTPDFQVHEAELIALSRVVKAHDGYLQVVPEGIAGESPVGLRREMSMIERVVDAAGVNVHVLMFQTAYDEHYYREQIAQIERMRATVKAYADFAGRSPGSLLSFLGTNPFQHTPTFERITHALPPDRWLAELARTDVKTAILSEQNRPGTMGEMFHGAFDRMYDLGDGLDFEPEPEQAMDKKATRLGTTAPALVYEIMLRGADRPRIYATFVNYVAGNLDAVADALSSPAAVLSASDAGAHLLTVCDGAIFTFMLTHWVRDRTRGPRRPLEEVVHWMTRKCADSIGLTDRGVLAPGFKADLNVIDFHNLTLQRPRYANDLPGAARRLAQAVSGYRATVVSGQVTRENDAATGVLPGRLLRHAAAGSPSG